MQLGATENHVSVFDVHNPPAYLRGVLAMNPKLAHHVQDDPGLRRFLEVNHDALVDFLPVQAPNWCVRDEVIFDVRCDPDDHDAYVLVLVRGSAYPGATVALPLIGGDTATAVGRILYVGKTRDYLHTLVAGEITLELLLFGKKGELVELSDCRIRPDDAGRVSEDEAEWRTNFVRVHGGTSLHVINPLTP